MSNQPITKISMQLAMRRKTERQKEKGEKEKKYGKKGVLTFISSFHSITEYLHQLNLTPQKASVYGSPVPLKDPLEGCSDCGCHPLYLLFLQPPLLS